MPEHNTFKTRVLFLAHLPPPVHGAAMAGNYIKTSTYINDELDTTYINLATNTKLEESGKWSTKKFSTLYKLLKTIGTTLRRNKIDICHMSLTASGPGFYKDFLVVALLKRFKVRIIYHFHNKGVKTASIGRINNELYKYVFKHTQSILLTPHLYDDIQKYVSKADVYYCPYGIPFEPIVLQNKEKAKPEICRFLYLSNMMQEKGAYILLEAIKLLRERNINFVCNFVGGWSDISPNEFAERVKQYDVSEFVFAHGPKYGTEKYEFYSAADVFIFPTFYHYETFGIVNLEAMQYGLPVIATPEGGIADVVKHEETGFLVPQKESR